jgi:hypothetical protein
MAKAPKSQRLKALATYRLLAARARVVLGTAKVQNKTLNALAKVAALSAVSNSKKLSASVQASLLVTGAKTGKFFTLIKLEDTFTATEIRNFNLSKLTVNEINAVDRALAEVYKALAEQTTTSELVTASVGKTASDVIAASEIVVRNNTKPLFDNFFVLDTPEKGVAKGRQDQFQTSEEILLNAAKQLDDLVGVGDLDIFDMSKPLGESFSALDTPSKGVFKGFQDQATASESSSRHFYKAVSDTISTADSLYFFLGAYRTSGVATLEDIEVVRIAEGGVPPQLDDQFATDFAALGTNKNLNDNVGVTDDFYGQANIDDDQVTFLGKNLPEPLLTSELRSVELQRTLQETATVGSSGLIALTDYCDSAYFSQAYVGTERIFS